MQLIIKVFFATIGSLFLSEWALAKTPIVQLETNSGTITLALYPDQAPVTVENFLGYVNQGFYDSTLFHRVIDGFMIQGGGLDENFKPKATQAPIENEANNGLKNRRGTIAMARTPDPHSATSQFFINLVDNPFLDFSSETPSGWGYAVFGKVIDGMDVVDQIAKVETTTVQGLQNVPVENIVIQKAQVLVEDSEPNYEATSRQVNLPIVQMGQQLYSAQMLNEGEGMFKVTKLDPLSASFSFPKAVYNPATEKLIVKRARVGERSYDATFEYLGDLRLKLVELSDSDE